jgi:hypothetical protein
MPITPPQEIPMGTPGIRLNFLVREWSASGALGVLDISNAANFQVVLLAPNGQLIVRTGNLTNGGADGIFGYTLAAGDVTVPGNWQAQGSFELPSGTGPFPTTIKPFRAFRNLWPLNLAAVGPAVGFGAAPALAAVPYPVTGQGSLWFPFGFDGIAGDTRDTYPTDGDGGINFANVLSPLTGSHMRDYSLVRLDALLITAASNGGNILLKRAADLSLIRTFPCPVPLEQPAELLLELPVEGIGGFTLASDQPTFILTAIAFYSLVTPTNP